MTKQASRLLELFTCRNLAGNAGLCNPTSGVMLPSALPACSDATLDAQQEADPAAVAEASSAVPTPTGATAPLAASFPTPQTGDFVTIVWPFLAVGLVGLAVCLIMAVRRKQRVRLAASEGVSMHVTY